jgi:hypothetical protein
MTILKLFSFYFLPVDRTLNRKGILKCWNIAIFKIGRLCHFYVLVAGHPGVLGNWSSLAVAGDREALLAVDWANALFDGLAVWTLRSSVEDADVLGVFDTIFMDVLMH